MPVEELLEEAELAIVADDLAAARACYRAILRDDPGHPYAIRGIREVERELEAWFGPGRTISLAVTVRDLVHSPFEARDTLLLAKLATRELTVEELASSSGLPLADVHEILFRGIAGGALRMR